jgi:hypothetical protein
VPGASKVSSFEFDRTSLISDETKKPKLESQHSAKPELETENSKPKFCVRRLLNSNLETQNFTDTWHLAPDTCMELETVN